MVMLCKADCNIVYAFITVCTESFNTVKDDE